MVRFLGLSVIQQRAHRGLRWWFVWSVCFCFSCIQHVEARQQVRQSEGAQLGDGIHEWGVRGGGQSASCFVLCLGCFGAAAQLPWREWNTGQKAFIRAGGCLTQCVFHCIKDMLIDANHTGLDVRKEDFGHTVEFDRVTAPHDHPKPFWFYGFKDQVHLSVISLVCLQTYIFTDGEDEELKKKIGEFHVGNRDAHCLIFLVFRKTKSYFKGHKNSALSFLPLWKIV